MSVFDNFEQMKRDRSPHERVWGDCLDYTYPRRSGGFKGSQITTEEAANTKARLSDSTATDGSRTLAAAIMSGMTPANSLWVGYDVPGASLGRDDRAWLDGAARTVWRNIHSGTWDADGYETVLDTVCAGWGAIYIDAHPQGGFRFVRWPISQVYLASSQPENIPDIVYRSFSLTAAQAVGHFGEAVGRDILLAHKSGSTDRFEFLHAIEPREGKRGPFAKNMPYASIKASLHDKRVLAEGGYNEMPVIVPRWMAMPDGPYADGPVFEALPDIKRLNELKRMELAAADIAVGGMWVAVDDGVVNPRTLKVGGRVVIPVTNTDNIKELRSGQQFTVSEYMINGMQRQIRRVLMADQLEPRDGPAMTATEVHARMGLVRQLLGPVYGRLQAELLGPLVVRCFGIAQRAGALGDMPANLSGRSASIVYLSPLARAQKLEEVSAIERLFVYATGIGQAYPQALDVLDPDTAVRLVGESLVVPHQVLRSEEAVTNLRAERSEEQESQDPAAQELLMKGAKTAVSKAAANMVPEQ